MQLKRAKEIRRMIELIQLLWATTTTTTTPYSLNQRGRVVTGIDFMNETCKGSSVYLDRS